ncbi:MAG: HAD family hydrolase [Sedimentisphaerales bacterium]|nr:HAD family hydrolase [Sedimentisphaerales bacterium]
MIKAVVFDLGETIFNFGKIRVIRLFRQGARLSYDYLKSCGQSVSCFECYCWRNLFALRLQNIISNITGNDFNSAAFLRGNGAKKGIKLDAQQWKHYASLWYEPLRKIATTEPDIKQTMAALKNAGLKLGILSNTFVNGSSLDMHLEQVGILEFFHTRVYSYEFDFRKPDLRIFKIAAERIGEALENILYVGDRIDKDIKPALKLGMKAVLKTAYTNTGKIIPDGTFKINRLSELPALVKKINNQKIPVVDKA